jgi:hypothetical protein
MRTSMLRYIDVVVISLAAPILLLAGAPSAGYAIGAATWIALRLLGDAVNRAAFAVNDLSSLVALRVGYRFVRVTALVLAVVVTEKSLGKHDGLTALLVSVFAFTLQLGVSIADHVSPSRARTASGRVHQC